YFNGELGKYTLWSPSESSQVMAVAARTPRFFPVPIERTVFPSVRVASESPDRADHQGEPGLPGKSRPLADHLLPHVEGRCFYGPLSAAKPRLQSDSRIERCTCVSKHFHPARSALTER